MTARRSRQTVPRQEGINTIQIARHWNNTVNQYFFAIEVQSILINVAAAICLQAPSLTPAKPASAKSPAPAPKPAASAPAPGFKRMEIVEAQKNEV